MFITLLIIFGILLNLLVLIGGLYLIFKYVSKINSSPKNIEVKVEGRNTTSEVISDGIKNAIREITYEYEQEKLLEKKSKQPENIYNVIESDKPAKKSGGNLIPYGLSESEKQILEMFYDD